MLYLEDYLEMIEHLPQELRDRFTEMREMDLQVQNSMDGLDERVKTLFTNAKKLKQEQRDSEFEKIRQDYYKSLEDADEKVQIANQIYDLVDRYLRRLDQELQKFKMELEADNAGITEILEKRSLELDNPPVSQKSEKRKYQSSSGSVLSNHLEKRPNLDKEKTSIADKESLSFSGITNHITASSSASSTSSSSSSLISNVASTCSNSMTSQTAPSSNTSVSAASEVSSMRSSSQSAPAISYNIGHMGAGSNAIAAAASQAIAATQLMQQGRRTASLKASYEAINSGLQNISREFSFGSSRETTPINHSSTNPTLPQVQETKSGGRPKKQSSRSSQQQLNVVSPMLANTSSVGSSSDLDSLDTSSLVESTIVDETSGSTEWSIDPNEPRYCICNQISYGDMVACDNADCPFEWFHYACVGITQPPKGKWYCPRCITTMKRRGRKDR